jgi:uncharacterized NAD(P)/FAD-binding protein YdhS
MSKQARVAIIGGGCSGTLVAAQLLRHGYLGEIIFIEPRTQLGRGLAYSTQFDAHQLNVPADRMSALPDEPLHFLNWIRERGNPEAGPGAFVARRKYGEYLEDFLRHEMSRRSRDSELRHICAEAIAVMPDGERARVLLSDGDSVEAQRVVLALGNPASSQPVKGMTANMEPLIQPSPWLEEALSLRFPSEQVLLLGTGLTAVDSMLALTGQSEDSRIYMISRRGLLPQIQTSCRPIPDFPPLNESQGLTSVVREALIRIERMKAEGYCWRIVIDALRPMSNRIWSALTLKEKQSFQRHLKPYWEPHRHRMALEIGKRVASHLKAGRLSVLAGRVRGMSRIGGSIRLTIVSRDDGEYSLEVDRIINCTGIMEDYAKSPRPLIRSMVADGIATANELCIGFRTDAHGALVNSIGETSKILFTLGPPRRGELFETTAVPEIRMQAQELARYLTGT